MNPFKYKRVERSADAVESLVAESDAAFVAGGTTLIDLMKEGVQSPKALIDINALPLSEIKLDGETLRVGALVKNSDMAEHPLIRARCPFVSEALLSGASQQLRNAATLGGNLLQRTRCYYFRDPAMPCNKRDPGSGCGAIDGFNRIHAVLGGSEHCIATHASDMCVPLVALDATIRVQGANRERSIPIREFYLLPGKTPERETVLERGELITGIDIPNVPVAANSRYIKVRDRASYEFALVSAAVALEINNGVIKTARLALGGVATVPWRATEAEKVLTGAKAEEATFQKAAEAEMRQAKGYRYNSFKTELAKRTIVRALAETAKV